MLYGVQAQLLLQGASCCGADGEAVDGEAVALQLRLPQQRQPAGVDGAVVTQPQLPQQPQPAVADGVAGTQLLPQVCLCSPSAAPTSSKAPLEIRVEVLVALPASTLSQL